ncbi:UDP-N-acetylglucosamine 1-carboxyvinyltransferase, partial [Patescibacteria group bacterium]|nr:UDP-N-acetylglucosamine 1-carboxyvinyltransferase [Patescibacteria group bacterium]
GSKNAALPIICAALLTNQKTILKNVPNIADIHSLIEILGELNCKTEFVGNKLTIEPKNIKNKYIDSALVCRMRASALLLGPLLARFKNVKMIFPGGCVLGKRPMDAHLDALSAFNAKVISVKDNIHIKTSGLKGADLVMSEISVTATENAIMTAVLAKGNSTIRLAAAEPHVQDLCHFLNKMGAKIKGIGSHQLEIVGVKTLKGIEYSITGDYLEAGTFAIAAVITNGEVEIKGINPDHLDSFWQKLSQVGANFQIGKNSVKIMQHKKLAAVNKLQTAVYPSFPTDLQAPFAVLLTQAEGVSKIYETLFEGRLNYLFELEKMGAKFEMLNPHQAIIIGPRKLNAASISSWDIRAGAAVVIAALVGKGVSEVTNIGYIDRGYEKFEYKLRKLGADIERK